MTSSNPIVSPLDDPKIRIVELPDGRYRYMVKDLMAVAGFVEGEEHDVVGFPDYCPDHAFRLPGLIAEGDEDADEDDDREFVHRLWALCILYSGRTPACVAFREAVDAQRDTREFADEPLKYAAVKILHSFVGRITTSRPPTWKWADIERLNPGCTFDADEPDNDTYYTPGAMVPMQTDFYVREDGTFGEGTGPARG